MATIKDVLVPDIGDNSDVEVIEILVASGDSVEAEDALITLETDKATMDVPAPFAGKIVDVKVQLGDKVSQGVLIFTMEEGGDAQADSSQEQSAPAAEPAQDVASSAAGASEPQEVRVPDIGDNADVEIIEILVAEGDNVEEEGGLITLETDKATMDVPAPFTGSVVELKVSVGDKVSQGDLVAMVVPAGAAPAPAPAAEKSPAPETKPNPQAAAKTTTAAKPEEAVESEGGPYHASPSIRRYARELGADLSRVVGTGRKGRIVKEDVTKYIKATVSAAQQGKSAGGSGNNLGFDLPAWPKVDFAKFGEVEEVPLTRIQKISGPALHRNWARIPHVTQFDEADITEMEAFRKDQKAAAEKEGVKLTPLAFMMKAVAGVLTRHPTFNCSLSDDEQSLIMKKYVHVGVAVDTPGGLVVPVVRDVDKKGIYDIARDLMEISGKARKGKLTAQDMQGGCFTISSLGGIGGTAFTPIVNAPEVAILGVSRSEIKPKWNGKEFEPRLMLPLSLSYDHRVIDGAVAARFIVDLSATLADLRKLIL
ncbi:MAG: dihydrolipoyllysine-residue acetyltransferase [Kangiellaceae bacterium]|nr:dihydrolipoyllysine-residue acetyltransferase [Kangiellaceae bacterium]